LQSADDGDKTMDGIAPSRQTGRAGA